MRWSYRIEKIPAETLQMNMMRRAHVIFREQFLHEQIAGQAGALLLEVGTIYLLLIAGFAWAQAGLPSPGRESGGPDQGLSRPA